MQFNLFRKLLFLAVLGSVIVFSSSPSFAQIGIPENPNEHISQFISEVSIRNDGSIKVRETISYDFGFESRRGIFRYIPYKYPYDGAKPKDAVDGSKYSRVTAFKLEKVFRDGSKDKNKVTEENSNKVIRIGEEDMWNVGDRPPWRQNVGKVADSPPLGNRAAMLRRRDPHRIPGGEGADRLDDPVLIRRGEIGVHRQAEDA